MYELLTNWRDVHARFLRGVFAGFRFAERPEGDLANIMRSGIQSHFNRLMHGGSDPSALSAGIGTSSVSWTTARHPFTIEEHRARGVDPKMLLVNTGQMLTAYTTNARVQGSNLPWGSEAVLSSASPEAEEKARKNLGGTHEAHFATINRSAIIDFPRRQFLYWDALMRWKVERAAVNAVETEWTR